MRRGACHRQWEGSNKTDARFTSSLPMDVDAVTRWRYRGVEMGMGPEVKVDWCKRKWRVSSMWLAGNGCMGADT